MAAFPAIDEVAWTQRFEIINMIQYKVASEFYGLMYGAYHTMVILQQDTAGRVGTGGTYTVATTTLNVTGLSSNFLSSDVGKLITFTDGTLTYCGFISAFLSSTSVQVQGNDLPVSNIAALTSVIVVSTVVSSDAVSISGIDMMRTGEQVNIDMQSTLTSSIEAVGLEALRFFRNMSAQNRNRIVYSLMGDRILLSNGINLTGYGTLTIAYPRSPIPVQQDADYIDLLDGGIINLAMLLLKKHLSERFYHEKRDYMAEAQVILADIYKNHDAVLKAQIVQEKALVLM
jgi:hypothetical protein